MTVTASRSSAAASTAGGVSGMLHKLGGALFGDDGFSFKDVLDLVNPLQHIPVVGNAYRNLTGDGLAPGIRVAGGALFGGPLGAALSLVGLAVERAGEQAAGETGPATDDPATAVAATPDETPRGGWMIAAATTGTVPAFVPVRSAAAVAAWTPAGPDVARGGWKMALAQPAAAGTAPSARVQAPQPPARELVLPARRVMLPLPPALPAPLVDTNHRSEAAEARAAALFASLQRQRTPPASGFVALA